jgi:hypothetical protein
MRKSVAKSNNVSLELKQYMDVQYYYVGELVCTFFSQVITYFKNYCMSSCLPFTGRNEWANTNTPQRKFIRPILVAARPRCFYGRAPPRFLGSNPERGMELVYCVVLPGWGDLCDEPIPRPEESCQVYVGVSVCVCVYVYVSLSVFRFNNNILLNH